MKREREKITYSTVCHKEERRKMARETCVRERASRPEYSFFS
jgi:hypothetical protein